MIVLHLEMFDEDRAAKEGRGGDARYSFEGMTLEQAEGMQAYVAAFGRALDRKIGEMKKYGEGSVLPEPGDSDELPVDTFAEKEALDEENEQADAAE